MINKNSMILLSRLLVHLCFLILLPSLIQATDVTLIIEDGSGFPGSYENPVEVSLINPNHHVKAVQLDIDDITDNIVCTKCTANEGRAPGFVCSANEQENGRCRVSTVQHPS